MLYIFNEPVGQKTELVNLDMGLDPQVPQVPQFMEAPMTEEWEVFEDIMEDGAGVLVEAFMTILVLQALGVQQDEPQINDVIFKEEILADLKDDENDLFELF